MMHWLIKCLSVLAAALLVTPAWPQKPSTQMEALKERVCIEYPQLRDEQLDDFSRVTLLRQWAWSHVRHAATTSNLLDNDAQIDWYHLDAAEIFQLFDQDRGGVMCGGTALALQRLYEAFGYTTWTVNSGDSDPSTAATHVTTLVRIHVSGGADVICVQDAYFNNTYVEATTERPLDYFDVLARLARGDHRSIRTIESDYRKIATRPSMIMAAKDVGGRKPHDIAAASFSVLEDDYTDAELADGSLKFTSPRTSGKFLDQLCHTADGEPAWYLAWLAEQGHPAEMVYLYLYPIGFAGPDSDTMLRKAQAVAAPGQFPAGGRKANRQ